MTDIHIPPAALEAGARAICEMEYGACDGGDTNPCSCTYWAAHARAAFVAMVEAWEGMSHAHNEEGEIKDWATWYSLPWHRAESSNGIILPLHGEDR